MVAFEHRAEHASAQAALRYQHATRDHDDLLGEMLDALAARTTSPHD